MQQIRVIKYISTGQLLKRLMDKNHLVTETRDCRGEATPIADDVFEKLASEFLTAVEDNTLLEES